MQHETGQQQPRPLPAGKGGNPLALFRGGEKELFEIADLVPFMAGQVHPFALSYRLMDELFGVEAATFLVEIPDASIDAEDQFTGGGRLFPEHGAQ